MHSWPRNETLVISQIHASATVPSGKAPRTYLIGGWVDRRADLDVVEKMRCLAPT
jgi:hypothetical protein